MAQHEHFCKKNPRNHALCYSCKFYEESTEQRYAVGGGGDMPEDCLLYQNECKQRNCYLYNGLRWRQDSIDYIKQYSSAFKPMPSVVEGCPYFEQYQEPTRPTIDQIRSQTEIEDLERIRRNVTKYFDID